MPDFDMPLEGSWEVRGGWVVRQLAADLNFTLEQAAGLVGNLGYESRGFETLQEIKPIVASAPGGWGWAQWTASRRRNFEAWCKTRLYDESSDIANYGFLVHELTGAYKSFADRLRKTSTIEDASRITHKEYETPSDVLDGSYRSGLARLDWAQRALNGALGGGVPAPEDTPEQKIKEIQMIIGTTPDGDFGPMSRAALNVMLSAAGQSRIRKE